MQDFTVQGTAGAGSNPIGLVVWIEVFGDSAWVPVEGNRFVFAFFDAAVVLSLFVFGPLVSCWGGGFGRVLEFSSLPFEKGRSKRRPYVFGPLRIGSMGAQTQ